LPRLPDTGRTFVLQSASGRGAEAPKLIRVAVKYDNEKLKAFLKQLTKKISDGGMPRVELAGADSKALIFLPQSQVINSDHPQPPHGVKVPTRLRPRSDI
jgi:hypothetical protein